ncbi:MAG: SpoVA/SpoVAEb family sporulation membrane protein [Clostridia bacterium]|nr:SpoVA/SpoVAEb family sporulation membrane protein [Clostridia bacterium]
MTGELYRRYAEGRARRSPLIRNSVKAFVVGGTICALAEALRQGFLALGADKDTAGLLVSLTLIVMTALFTGLGLFDKLAKHAGGGTLVPITGFANAIASEAIDAKPEGYILGVGAKIFTIAGPVILYGTAAGTLWGLLYWFILRFR